MAPHEQRGRIDLRPLGADRALAEQRRAFPRSFPRGWTALAEVWGPDKGWLVRDARTGALAVWLATGRMRSVDARKAEAALAALKPVNGQPASHDWETDPRPLADCLKAWHAERGWTRDQAAAELRVSRTTYDGWCAGRRTDREASLRRMMTLIDSALIHPSE